MFGLLVLTEARGGESCQGQRSIDVMARLAIESEHAYELRALVLCQRCSACRSVRGMLRSIFARYVSRFWRLTSSV